MSPQNFSSRKRTGGIKESLINHAIEKGANPIYLRTGQGSPKAEDKTTDYWKGKAFEGLEARIKALEGFVISHKQFSLERDKRIDKINDKLNEYAETGDMKYLKKEREAG